MANINVGVSFSGTPPGSGPSGPSGPGAGPNPKPGAGAPTPASNAADAAREAAARRALTQRMGKTFTDAQIAQVARDFAEMSRSSQRLRRFGGDIEKWMNGFSQTFPSRRQANSHYGEVMQQLGLGPAQGPGGIGSMLAQAMRGIFRATGAGGGVAGGIMHQGYTQAGESEGGMGSAGGMGMLAKGAGVAALAYVGIKAVQKVGQKVGDAQDEAIQYHDLRQSVGGASVDFETLRESVRFFTNGLGVTSAESAKLARSYAMSSQVFGKVAETGIGASVGRGVEMSRGYGLAPEAGVDFLAAMRHFKASDGSERGDQKLAFMIGDAVGKTGAFSKADEVMTAIAQFTETSTRQSLNSANVAGYAEMMGALGGLKLPGMDAKGTASVVGQVQGNWASGGGIAGQNMRLGWMNRGFGALATDMGRVGDAGPMGSAESTFGESSAAYKLAKERGDGNEMERLLGMAKKGGSTTFFDQEMTAMKGAIKDPAFLRLNVAAKYGTSDAGADSLITTHGKEDGMTGLMDRVNAAVKAGGKDPAKINKQSIARLSMIDNADSSELENMREKALKYSGDNALSASERSSLTGAKGDDLKTVLTQIEAMRASEDEGKTAREAQVNLDRKFQEFATKIIPLTNFIQEGVFKLVDKFGGGLSDDMKQFQSDKKYQDKLDKATTEEEKKEITAKAIAKAKAGPMSEKDFDRQRDEIWRDKDMTLMEKSAAESKLSKRRDASREAVTPTDIKKAIADEANKNASEIRAKHEAILNGGSGSPASSSVGGKPGGKTPRNLRNNNPGNIEAGKWANDHGAIGSDGRFAIFPDKETGSAAMDSLLQKYSKKDGLNTVSGIVGKWAPSSENNTSAYSAGVAKRLGVRPDETINMQDPRIASAMAKEMARIEGSADAYADKSLPTSARPAGGASQVAKVDVNVNGVMVGPDGRSHPLGGNGTGQFKQTSAGMRSRG